jgi:hypothetical protein
MKRVCAWCKSDLGTTDSGTEGDDRITHGICDTCRRSVSAEGGVELREYLDMLEAPVLAVGPDVVVKIANEKACRLVCKQPREVAGRKGGDVFECSYARLPGGCGKTIHCSGCAIRLSVEETYRTGLPRLRVPAYLRQGEPGAESEVSMHISTEKVGDLVLLRIDRVDPAREVPDR